jgi:hypothetical protein
VTDPTQLAEAKGAEAAYQKLLPQALALDPRDLLRFSADARLAQHNMTRAVEALIPQQEKLAKKLKDEALKELNQHIYQAPLIGQALLFADLEVERHRKGSTGETAKKLAELRELRALMLDSARTCARAKLINAEEVHKIERGKGPFDAAEDCIALARLYRENATQMKGATPVTVIQIERAAELGTELSAIFQPADTTEKIKPSENLKDATNIRNRLWTMLNTSHEAIWSAGALVFGYTVSEEIPFLQSRTVEVKEKTTPTTT